MEYPSQTRLFASLTACGLLRSPPKNPSRVPGPPGRLLAGMNKPKVPSPRTWRAAAGFRSALTGVGLFRHRTGVVNRYPGFASTGRTRRPFHKPLEVIQSAIPLSDELRLSEEVAFLLQRNRIVSVTPSTPETIAIAHTSGCADLSNLHVLSMLIP